MSTLEKLNAALEEAREAVAAARQDLAECREYLLRKPHLGAADMERLEIAAAVLQDAEAAEDAAEEALG